MKVRIEPIALEHITEARTWWRTHRKDARDLFDEELTEALQRIVRAPRLSTVFEEVDGTEVRRVLLKRCRYALYFIVHDDELDVVALWHTARGGPPPL